MGAKKERGAGKEERGGAGGDFSTSGQKEESGIGARGSGESVLALISVGTSFKNADLNSLVSQGNKHKQISDRLRDAQSMRRIQKAEVDLINQKRDARIAEINTLQLEFEVKPFFFLPLSCILYLTYNHEGFFLMSLIPAGLAEEALSACSRTTASDREAAKHQPQ